MPITSIVGRKNWSQRCFIGFIYAALTLFGATMAIPFLITLTSSGSNAYDYDRFSILPRTLWSAEDRMFKTLPMFIDEYPNWYEVLHYHFPDAPPNWTSWRSIGLDRKNVERIVTPMLRATPEDFAKREIRAGDYAEFALAYPLEDSRVTVTKETASLYVSEHYRKLEKGSAIEGEVGALERIAKRWGVPIESYTAINFLDEQRAALAQQSYSPSLDPKYEDYQFLAFALQHGYGLPGILPVWKNFLKLKNFNPSEIERLTPLPSGASPDEKRLWLEFARTQAPASSVIPFPMQLLWLDFLNGDEARDVLKLDVEEGFSIEKYNRLAGTSYVSFQATPFPLPDKGFDGIRPLWNRFVESRYPLRLSRIVVDQELQKDYEQFLQKRYISTDSLNRLIGTDKKNWNEFILTQEVPAKNGAAGGLAEIWMDFVKTLPASKRFVRSSESVYQDFLRSRYSSLEELNRVYGWNLELFEEAKPPFADAYAEIYRKNTIAFVFAPLVTNYSVILDFLLRQGRVIPVTLWLIILSIAATLTINPIAAYALSRFNLRNKDKIILFCLATAAFPAMVSAIPGYLLMRDLGLLNTFFALVLPGAANGMAIFILKGFYDSLPAELFEAATIDGAKEWQIFLYVTLPMIKPILAINALNAFLHAYSSWEWALIICQKKSMWTVSVWLYQASQWWVDSPWITTAGFVIASIPTLIVFLFCQNIIMRGIIVPSMK